MTLSFLSEDKRVGAATSAAPTRLVSILISAGVMVSNHHDR